MFTIRNQKIEVDGNLIIAFLIGPQYLVFPKGTMPNRHWTWTKTSNW